MQRFLAMMLRRYALRFVMRTARRGLNRAMTAGGRRGEGFIKPTIDQDPAITSVRKRMSDERKGDEILYPTDDFTHNMQPRK